MSVGAIGTIGLKQETTFGTEATPPDVFEEARAEKLTFDFNYITKRYIGGVRDTLRVLPGALSGKGPVDIDLIPEKTLGWFLKGIFGKVSTSTLVPGVYQHVFEVLQSSKLPSFTMQAGLGAGTYNFLGCNMESFSVGIKPNNTLESSVGLIAQNIKKTTPITPSYTTLNPWMAQEIDISLAGNPIPYMESLDLNFNNTYEPVFALNNKRYALKHVAKQFMCDGKFNLEFDNTDILERIFGTVGATEPQQCIDPTTLSVAITKLCPEGEIVVGSGYYYSLTFDYYEVYLHGFPTNTGPDNRIMYDVNFFTKYDRGQAASVKVTLVNGQSGFPNP